MLGPIWDEHEVGKQEDVKSNELNEFVFDAW